MKITCTALRPRSLFSGIAASLVLLSMLLSGSANAQTTSVAPDGWVVLPVDGAAAEVVTVTGGVSNINNNAIVDGADKLELNARRVQQLQLAAPTQNVFNLQRRVAGVLPVKVDVPQAGRSYKFVRPLVIDEETRISFQYKTK